MSNSEYTSWWNFSGSTIWLRLAVFLIKIPSTKRNFWSCFNRIFTIFINPFLSISYTWLPASTIRYTGSIDLSSSWALIKSVLLIFSNCLPCSNSTACTDTLLINCSFLAAEASRTPVSSTFRFSTVQILVRLLLHLHQFINHITRKEISMFLASAISYGKPIVG